MKTTLKISPPLRIFFCRPSLLLKIIWNFSWWLLTVTATPHLMLNWKWYQASKSKMEFHMINVIISSIAHARTNRDDNIFIQIWLYIDEAHTELDIFRFAALFLIHHQPNPSRNSTQHVERYQDSLINPILTAIAILKKYFRVSYTNILDYHRHQSWTTLDK